MNAIENFKQPANNTLYSLAQGDVFKFVLYPLTEQPIFVKLEGQRYTALTTVKPERGFIRPGTIINQHSDSPVIVLDATISVKVQE